MKPENVALTLKSFRDFTSFALTTESLGNPRWVQQYIRVRCSRGPQCNIVTAPYMFSSCTEDLSLLYNNRYQLVILVR